MAWSDHKYEPRVCVICGKRFVPKVGTQKTCSSLCGRKWNRIQTLERMKNAPYYTEPNGDPKATRHSTMDEIREIAKKGIHYGHIVAEMEHGNKV